MNEQQLAQQIGQAVHEFVTVLNPLGSHFGSNRLFRVETTSGAHYVAKFPKPVREECSPFWQQMDAIFGINCVTQLSALPAVVAPLRQQSMLAVPEVIYTERGNADGTEPYGLVTYLPGTSYEPDLFPAGEGLHEQLGQYVGFLHTHAYPGYGNLLMPSLRPQADFFDVVVRQMRRVITTFWQDDTRLHHYLDQIIAATDPAAIYGQAALIMTDISGNQFVYGDDRIAGVVDLDAYVIGPREWELTILEMCITEPAAFRRGYECYLPLPSFAPFRNFYRLWSYLCDPEEVDGERFAQFMQQSIHFA